MRKAYVVVIKDEEGRIQDTPFATFDRGLAQEVALSYAWELMWEHWLYHVHQRRVVNGWVSSAYASKLTDYNVDVKEITWHG